MVESAKWQAWSQLQDMAPVEAMRLYVRLLEDELVCPYLTSMQRLLITSAQPSVPAQYNLCLCSDVTSYNKHAMALHDLSQHALSGRGSPDDAPAVQS